MLLRAARSLQENKHHRHQEGLVEGQQRHPCPVHGHHVGGFKPQYTETARRKGGVAWRRELHWEPSVMERSRRWGRRSAADR